MTYERRPSSRFGEDIYSAACIAAVVAAVSIEEWRRCGREEKRGERKELAKEGSKGPRGSARRHRRQSAESARARLNFQRGRARLIYLPVQRSIVLPKPVESPWLFRDLERWRR